MAEPRSGDDLAQLLKMIKAVLAHNDVSYERTHNIAYLLTLLDSASIPKPGTQPAFPI